MKHQTKHQSAAMLVIGNEVLSGRTREANAWLTARMLFDKGCKLGEIAIVPDQADAIISTLNRLRSQFDAVITSGGIGPTHDDITMQAVADAFAVPLLEHADTLAAMRRFYGEDKVNPGRRRMARLPDGARPIICDKSIAPGAHIGNVYVLAGVPDIFASQLQSIIQDFGDRPYQRHEIEVSLPESAFARALTELQQRYHDVEIGSYPHRCGPNSYGKICLSSQSPERLQQAASEVESMLQTINT
ncbi:MAG: molybdopterin-binding protein [Mariprofundaceae bacterium]